MKHTITLMAAAFLSGSSLAIAETPIDVDKPFICTPVNVIDCQAQGGCTAGPPAMVNLPTFLEFSLKQNRVKGKRPDGSLATSEIMRRQQVGDSLLLQGNDGSRVWSGSINRASGKMVATAAMEDGVFILFGACMQPRGE